MFKSNKDSRSIYNSCDTHFPNIEYPKTGCNSWFKSLEIGLKNFSILLGKALDTLQRFTREIPPAEIVRSAVIVIHSIGQMRGERDLVPCDALQHEGSDVYDEIDAEIQWNVPKLLAYVVIRVWPLVEPLIVHFRLFGVVFRYVVVDHLVIVEVVMMVVAVRMVVVVWRMIQMAGILDRFRWIIVVRRVRLIIGVVGIVGRHVGIRFVGIWWLKTIICAGLNWDWSAWNFNYGTMDVWSLMSVCVCGLIMLKWRLKKSDLVKIFFWIIEKRIDGHDENLITHWIFNSIICIWIIRIILCRVGDRNHIQTSTWISYPSLLSLLSIIRQFQGLFD